MKKNIEHGRPLATTRLLKRILNHLGEMNKPRSITHITKAVVSDSRRVRDGLMFLSSTKLIYSWTDLHGRTWYVGGKYG